MEREVKRSKHFKLHEFFPEELYQFLKATISKEIMWRMINPKLIASVDKLKEKFPEGSMSINNYFWNKNRGWSGLRTKGSPYYKKTSQHSDFNAADCVFSAYTTKEVREYILNNPAEFPEIGGIEIATWLHLDVRKRVDGKILIFRAKKKKKIQ